MNGRDSAENERQLCLRERRRSLHEADVAYRSVPADGDVEQRRPDATGKDSSLQRAAARVPYIEYQLVDQRLGRQARCGKKKLLVRVLVGVDSREDRWASFIESYRWTGAHCDGGQDVGSLVRQNAGAETESKISPVVVPWRGRIDG